MGYRMPNQPSTSTNRKPRIVSRTIRKYGNKITPTGMAYLKCAFAPPDFLSTGVTGIPDSFRGRTLLKKHRIVQPINLLTIRDYYYVILPTPGVAYWTFDQLAAVGPVPASAVWTPVYYADSTTLLPTIQTANVVNAFRYVSNHIEIISNNNQMTWSGSISSFKIPIKFIERGFAASTTDRNTITGFDSINSTNCDMYNGTLFEGIYTAAYANGAERAFAPIIEQTGAMPQVFNAAVDFMQLSGQFAGFDNTFEATLVKISGITQTQSVTIKTWACVEYAVANNSPLYDYSAFSPSEDELAMRAYAEVVLQLPLAVPVRMNASFWNRVLQIIKRLSAYGSILPGPVGMISGGVNLLSQGIEAL
jgi:hypothetical protein